MSLPQMAVDDAGPILFTMHSNTQSSPKAPHSPPPLPKRNARRASRFLDALLDSSAPTTATTPTTVTASAISAISSVSATSANANKNSKSSPKMTTTAHEVYLSSEEDASSLGDVSDYDDAEEYDYDSDTVEYIGAPVVLQVTTTTTPASTSSSAPSMPTSAPPTSTAAPPLPTTEDAALPARRHSHEDKARLVSVVYAGKPSLVDLAVERAARRRSLNDRTTSPSPSASCASMVSSARSNRSHRSDSSASRPSTSAGTAPSTAFSSMNASPQRLQHKRNSSGSMVASYRAYTALETIADSPTMASQEMDMPKPTRAYTTSSSRMPHPNTAVVSATAAAASPLSSSPRTPTFGHSNLLRGVTRTLTLSRRGSRLLNKDRDSAFPPPPPPSTYTPTALPLPGQLPGVAGSATSDVSILRRKSLAMSVSLGLGNGGNDKSVPSILQTHDEHMFTTSIAPALRRASTSSGAFLSPPPSHRVLSKKNGNGNGPASPSASSFFSRRRSMKLM